MKSAHLNCFAARERLQGARQLAHLRHARPINQNRYDRNVVGKCRSDFDCNEVVRTVDPTSRFVLGIQPAGTDDRQKHLAHRHLIFYAFFKVGAGEIHEEIFVPKCLRHPVVQPTSALGRTFSTVIDENLAAHVPDPENKFYRRTGQINRPGAVL